MVKYDKNHLSKLLDFIRVLYEDPSNGEFAEGLRDIVGTAKSQPTGDKIDKIEKYLALDFGLDKVENPDYAFIGNREVRDTLNADWREMLRSRYGLRGHRVDFGEVCRFAELQVEMLVNLYYIDKYGNEDKVLEALKANAEKANEAIPEGGYKELVPTFISMKAEVFGLKHELGLPYQDIKPILNIIDVRNGESHRSPEWKKVPIDKRAQQVEETLKMITERIKEAMTY